VASTAGVRLEGTMGVPAAAVTMEATRVVTMEETRVATRGAAGAMVG